MRPTSQQQMQYGWLSGAANPVSINTSLNAAATWNAFSFFVTSAKTLSNVHIFLTNNGSLTTGAVRMDIYSNDNTNAVPSTSLANVTNGATIVTGWNDFTFSLALTAMTQYWVVVRNLNGTPASNFPQTRQSANGAGAAHLAANATAFGYHRRLSADSGSTWTSSVNANTIAFMRLDFNDATYGGYPLETSVIDTTNTVFSTRELGMLLTTPTGTKLNVVGVSMPLAKTGSPTGNYQYKIYQGTTLVATTQTVPCALVQSGSGYYSSFFTAAQVLEPGVQYRVVLSRDTNADTTTNSLRLYAYTLENTATSLTFQPYGTGSKKTYFNGSAWVETSTDFVECALILDDTTPTVPVATDFAYF
jgi:hypothetical protein